MNKLYVFFGCVTLTAVISYRLQMSPVYAAQGTSGNGRILVKVVLNGKPPSAAKIQLAADPVCVKQNGGQPMFDQVVEANASGGLKDVLVYVKDGISGSYPAPKTVITLDQSGCTYKPHVLGLMAGQQVEILNSDPTLHNIHVMPVVNAGFNIGQPVKGLKTLKTFPKPEPVFHVKCDVHSWMSAYIAVFNHPYFDVSNENGEAELKNMPAGTFQIQAWQEKYGVQTQTVTLNGGDTKQVTFTYKAQ
jgi:plastocyanin